MLEPEKLGIIEVRRFGRRRFLLPRLRHLVSLSIEKPIGPSLRVADPGLIPSRRLRPVNPRSGSVRQGASSARGAFAGGAHFIGHEAREAEPSVVDAIIAVRAFFDRATMALVGKQLLRHDAAEFAILADIAETVQIQPFGSPAGM